MPGFNINAGQAVGPEPSIYIEPLRNHRWRIVALGADGATGGVIGRDKLCYAKTLQLPEFAVEEEQIPGSAIKYKFAKMVNWGDVTVTFYDVDGVYGGLIGWQNKVYEPNTGIKLADDYKKQCRFQMTDGSGRDTGPLYRLIGSWPKNISHSALSYEDSELKLINLVISYDWAEIKFGTQT